MDRVMILIITLKKYRIGYKDCKEGGGAGSL